MKCPRCGIEVNENDKICPMCGAGIDSVSADGEQEAAAEEPKKKGRAGIILAIIVLIAAVAAIFSIVYYRNHYIAKEIHLSKNSVELITGESVLLNYEIIPATTKNKNVTWFVDDDSVATVDENGTVLALGSGTCVVTVMTSNDKYDSCEVKVKDFVDIQKESVDAVLGLIKNSKTETSLDGVSVLAVKKNSDGSTFSIGTNGENLILLQEQSQSIADMDVEASYRTSVCLEYGNIEAAQVEQSNVVEICGVPVTTTVCGQIILAEYQPGAKVKFDSVESTLDGMAKSKTLQKIVNRGVKSCAREFESFLIQHPELGCKPEDFGFVSVFEDVVEVDSDVCSVVDPIDSGICSVPDSIAEAISSYADVESAVEPAAESVVESVVEDVMQAAADSMVESVVEAPIVVPSVETTIAPVESVVEAVESIVESAPAVESAVESIPAVAEQVVEIEPVAESAVESVSESVVESMVESMVESVVESIVEPVDSAVGSVPEQTESTVADAFSGIKKENTKLYFQKMSFH